MDTISSNNCMCANYVISFYGESLLMHGTSVLLIPNPNEGVVGIMKGMPYVIKDPCPRPLLRVSWKKKNNL